MTVIGVATPSQEFDLAVTKRQAVADVFKDVFVMDDLMLELGLGAEAGGATKESLHAAVLEAMHAEVRYRIGTCIRVP